MLKSKFQHMGEREHYKMYKAGKTWLFASIIAMSLGTVLATTGQSAKADAETKPATEVPTSTNASTAGDASSATLSSSSVAPASNQSQSTSAAGSVKTAEPSADQTVKNASAAISSQTPASATLTDQSNESSLITKASQTASIQTKEAASDNVSLAPASAARSGADSTNSSSAASDGKSAASSADSSTSTSTQMNATSTANTVASQSTTAVSKLPGSSTQSQGAINSSSVASVNAKQLVAGAVITETADSAVTISLPAGGATQSDIDAAKKAIAATHVTKAMIIAKDDATDVGYANGVAAAKANFAQGMENVYQNNITGWLNGGDVDPSSLNFSDLQKNTDGYVHSTDASDKTAKTRIDTWVDAQLAKIDWTTISNSTFYAGDNSWTADQTTPTAEEQRGYLDTVKAYLRGYLVSEAYYLWLLQASNNSDNSKYFGLQGKLDDFQTLRTQMETADQPGSLTGSQADFYSLGFESALDGIVGHPQNPSNPQTVAIIAQKIFGDGNSYSPTGYGDSLVANIAKDYGNQNMDAADYQLGSRGGVNKTKFLPPVDQLLQSNPVSKTNSDTNALEKEIFKTAFINYYASWQNVVAQAFTAATEDALSGKSAVLDNSISPTDLLAYIDQRMPAEYASQTNTDSSNNQKNLYQAMYLVARSYLSGKYSDVAGKLTGNGNTAIPAGLTDQAALSNPKGTQVISPLDLAIYSVLTGHTFKYTVSEKGSPIVSSTYQTSPTTSASADWTDGPAQNDMYQLALNVANQAKTDFLSDVQLAINQGDLSKLASAATFLPNATSQGGLSESQYAYYKQNSYVYYKVFSALYHSFFTDKDGNSTNVIAKAIADADTYVKQSGDSHNGQPISQSLADAKKDNPDLTATANGSDIKLNADVTYTAPYSEDSTGTPVETVTVLKDKAASKQGDSTSTITSTELSTDNQDNAKKVIQNAIDYAYVHEEAMAIPAYEAGYAAVQRNLNVTPTSAKPALGNPSSDTYQFENKSTVTDILTPVLTTTNPDGTTIWTVHYSNADGTNTLVTITRGANTANPSQGKLTSLQMVVTKDSATLGDSGVQTTGSTSVSYPSVQLNDDVTNDGKKQTTVSVSANTDGTLNYTFVRDALNTVKTSLSADGKTTTSDGTSSGKLYQAGWDYRKSFISQMTLVQQAADTNFKNDKVTEDNNKLTEDQTYAGFFQSTDKDGKIVHNSTIQLQPITDVNGAYGTYLKKTITNLDGSKVDITLNVDGSLVYTVYDVNGKVSATNGTGTLGAKDSQVIITNQDATADEEPSQVTIRRTSNDAITVSEIGLQDKMVNDLTVTNTQTAADATVVMGKNVEPSFSSTTIVTPVSALHQGVVLTADPSFGTNGIKSTYEKKNADGSVTNTPDDTNGLTYHGYVTDASSADNTKDYGTAENSTTTIQYIATNVSNSATKTTMTVNTTQPGPSITISLGKDTNGKVQSTTSFDTSKVTADNTGSEIFEWSGVTNLPAGWTYDDTNKTLTYKPTSDADKAALINALAKTGTYAVNWSGAKDATAPALVDQFGDVMNLVIDTKVKSQNSITANVDTSDSTKVNADHQYTFSNADIVSATKANDPNGMVTAFIKNLAGTSGKTYEGTMNGLPLPNGVKSVTLNADGSVTVTFDPDKATANYDKATNTNVIKLVLPFTVDSNGQYIPDTGDTTNKTPLDNLTLNMNMQADLKLAYQAAAGGTDTTVKDGNSTDNVAYVQAGQDLQSPVTRNGLALGSTYSATVPATINAASTANYQGASYKLINGVATNDPNAVNFNDTQLTFGGNTSTYLYAKTYGSVWNVTNTAPSLTDVPSEPVSDGITTTIDLSNAAKDFNWQTVSFQPDANTAANYTTTVTVNKDAKSLTVTYKPRDAATDLDFLADTYQDGFDLNGWLTDTQTPAGSKTPVMHNALYVKTKTAPLKLADFTKKATINVAKSGDGYDAGAKTYTFDVPSTALSVKQLALLANGQKLVLTSGSSQADLEKGNSSVNADNWKNITGVTMSLSADGTSAHIVATLNTAFAKSNVQKGAVLTLGADGDSPLASGIHLELTLVNDLKQQASGLPADLPKESQPVYPTEADQALNSRFVAKSQAVTGYAVVSATDQNNKTLQITKNADGSASYAVNYDWGVETGDPVADQITWNYAQAEIDGSIGSQTKVYGKDDPSTPYTVTLPSWLTAPKWTKDDFERDNDTSEDVGDHNIKLSAKGISDLAAANKSFTIDATTLAKLTDGTLTITPTVTVEYVDQDGNELAGKKAVDITDEKKGATITISQPSVAGYTVENNQPTSYTLTGAGSQTVKVVYRQNAAVTANYYVVGTTNKIANSVTTNGGVGLSYTTNAAQIPGYTLVATPSNATGTYVAAGSTVNYEYTVDYSIVPVDSNGNKIPNVPAPSGTGTPGQPVAPTGGYPTIPGYTRTTTPNVPDKPGQVNVVYTPLTETVTVNYYIQGTTTPIVSSVTLSGPFGSNYQSTPAKVSGYKLIATPANASGMYGVTNDAVNYYYELIVTVVPKTPDGKPVPGTMPTQQPGVPGQPSSNVPQIPGYKVTVVPEVPGQPGVVEVIYTPMTTPEPTPTQSVDTQTVTQVAAKPVPVRTVEQTTPAQQTTVKKTHVQLVPEVHAPARVADKSQAKVLPYTGQQSSFALVIAGLGMMAAGFIFLGVRKYRRS